MEACFCHEIKNKKLQLFIYNSELIFHNSISLVSIKSESQKLVRSWNFEIYRTSEKKSGNGKKSFKNYNKKNLNSEKKSLRNSEFHNSQRVQILR